MVKNCECGAKLIKKEVKNKKGKFLLRCANFKGGCRNIYFEQSDGSIKKCEKRWFLYKIRLKKKILQEEILSFQDAAVCYALNTIKFDFVFFMLLERIFKN